MLRRSFSHFVADFGESKKKFPPYIYLGSGNAYGIGRAVVRKNKRGNFGIHRTVDENRLIKQPTLAHLAEEIDKSYLTEKGWALEDIRWLDERRLKWQCKCGNRYWARTRDRTWLGYQCKACLSDSPSAVDATIRTVNAGTVKECPFRDQLTKYDAASRRTVTIECPGCKEPMRRTVRSLTGVSAPGCIRVEKTAVCRKCLWKDAVMKSPELKAARDAAKKVAGAKNLMKNELP